MLLTPFCLILPYFDDLKESQEGKLYSAKENVSNGPEPPS